MIEMDGNTENIPKNGALPTIWGTDSIKAGHTKTSIHAGFYRCAPHAPYAPLKNGGIRLDGKNNEVKSSVPEGVQ